MAVYPAEQEYWDEEDDEWLLYEAASAARPPVNPPVVLLLAMIAFGLFAFAILRTGFTGSAAAPAAPATAVPPGAGSNPAMPEVNLLSAELFVAPYDEYWVTQGLHGASYGHMAIDIAAGKGATIRTPITGVVSRRDVDGVGNPVLVIENDVYRVTMLHGVYSVAAGDQVQAGDPVGEESNIGYTTDMQGRLCAGRDCGYHTHLNVFDKRVGANVDPRDLLESQGQGP